MDSSLGNSDFHQRLFFTSSKSRLQEVRAWIKNLPTYSMSLTDGAWQVLDAPVIKEIDRLTKSFYAVQFSSYTYLSTVVCFPSAEKFSEDAERKIQIRLLRSQPPVQSERVSRHVRSRYRSTS